MPFNILILALFAIFTILPASNANAAPAFYSNLTAMWTTAGTSTTSSTQTVTSTTESTFDGTATLSDSGSLSLNAQSSQSSSSSGSQMARYVYDELDRLKWVQYEDGTVISYDYDKVGNRTVKTTYVGQLANTYTITAAATGFGSIVPSGTINVPPGGSQTFLIIPGALQGGTPCPSGYTFVTARNRCEATPQCPSPDQAFNPTTQRCEYFRTSTYQASCASGRGSINTATGWCEYSATAVARGGHNFDVPVYHNYTDDSYSNPCRPPYIVSGSSCYYYDDYEEWDYYSPFLPIRGYLSSASFSGAVPVYSGSNYLLTSSPGTLYGHSSPTYEAGMQSFYVQGRNMGYLALSPGYSQTYYDYTCPNGGTPSGTVCRSTPVCPSGGVLNGQTCTVNGSFQGSCNAGQGTLNASTGQCEYAATATTRTGYYFDRPVYVDTSNNNRLYSSPCISPGYPVYWGDGCFDESAYFQDPNPPLPVVSYLTATPLPGYVPVYNGSGGDTTLNGISGTVYGYASSSNLGGMAPIYRYGTVFSSLALGTLAGYMAPTPGYYGQSPVYTEYTCPNGGNPSGGVCQNSPVCPNGSTLSGADCLVVGNPSSLICANGTFDASNLSLCYANLGGILASVVIDGVDVMSDDENAFALPYVGSTPYHTFTNVTGGHTITANFTTPYTSACTDYPARLAKATPLSYPSLQSAYNVAADGDTVQGNMYDHFESLLLDRNVTVALDGGYSCDYTTKTGNLTIKGGLTVSGGSVTVTGNVVLATP